MVVVSGFVYEVRSGRNYFILTELILISLHNFDFVYIRIIMFISKFRFFP